MDHVMQRMREANELVHRAGPYLLLEILLPGGTLFAFLFFLYRRSHPHAAGRPALGFTWVTGRVADALDLRIVAGRALPSGERDGLEPLGFNG